MTQDSGSPAVRQEPNTISTRAVVLAGLVVIGVSAIGVGAMDLMLRARRAEHKLTPVTSGISASPLEHTNIIETARGQEFQERARSQLDEWGWVEKGKVARIPVHEASRWLLQDAERGDLVWRDQETGATQASAAVRVPAPALDSASSSQSTTKAPPKVPGPSTEVIR